MNLVPSDNAIRSCIYIVRGQNVMLDCDLAKFYGIETGALKRAVRRNIKRFPSDFMFELTREEFEELRVDKRLEEPSDAITEGRGGARYRPFAFSEPGVAMLSSVLNSEKAVEICVAIVRNFLRLREKLISSTDIHKSFDQVNERFERLEQRLEAFEANRMNLKANLVKNEIGSQNSGLGSPNSKYKIAHQDINCVDLPSKVLNWVAQNFQVSARQLKSNSRQKKIIEARHCGMYLIRKHSDLSLSEIASVFGKRDHTTVIHACSKVEQFTDPGSAVNRCINFVNSQLEKYQF